MKLTETVSLVNADKVVFGSKEISLTLDTETGRLVVDSPAMFTNPVIRFHDLKEVVAKIDAHLGRKEDDDIPRIR